MRVDERELLFRLANLVIDGVASKRPSGFRPYEISDGTIVQKFIPQISKELIAEGLVVSKDIQKWVRSSSGRVEYREALVYRITPAGLEMYFIDQYASRNEFDAREALWLIQNHDFARKLLLKLPPNASLSLIDSASDMAGVKTLKSRFSDEFLNFLNSLQTPPSLETNVQIADFYDRIDSLKKSITSERPIRDVLKELGLVFASIIASAVGIFSIADSPSAMSFLGAALNFLSRIQNLLLP